MLIQLLSDLPLIILAGVAVSTTSLRVDLQAPDEFPVETKSKCNTDNAS